MASDRPQSVSYFFLFFVGILILYCAVDAAFYGMWPTGAAFQLQTVFEHYLYVSFPFMICPLTIPHRFDPTNITFVQRVYPLFRGASQFFLETLQVHPNHTE
jgi:hypothetical protein